MKIKLFNEIIQEVKEMQQEDINDFSSGEEFECWLKTRKQHYKDRKIDMIGKSYLQRGRIADFDTLFRIYNFNEKNGECKAQCWLRSGGAFTDWYDKSFFKNCVDVTDLEQSLGLEGGYDFDEEHATIIFNLNDLLSNYK